MLDHQIEEVETALGEVRECRDHVEQSLKVGTPQQVLSTKSQMMSHTESVINSVEDKRFQPLEQADIELVKSDQINEIPKNIVKYSFLSSSKVSASYCPIPLTDQESTITISFVFTPVTRGNHQLHVRVYDIEISGSPLSIPVSVPPEKRGTPVKTISGLRDPSGVAVTDDGLVIVSEKEMVTVLPY